MASQPANADIQIFRNVRSYRKNLRHEAVAALTKRLRPLIMSVPGHEILVGVLTRDTALQDLGPFCGQARMNPNPVTPYTAIRGFPIVYGVFDELTFATAVDKMSTDNMEIDFPFQIGSDQFITNTPVGAVARDLQGDLQTELAAWGTTP